MASDESSEITGGDVVEWETKSHVGACHVVEHHRQKHLRIGLIETVTYQKNPFAASKP